jgi:hypothetical protein
VSAHGTCVYGVVGTVTAGGVDPSSSLCVPPSKITPYGGFGREGTNFLIVAYVAPGMGVSLNGDQNGSFMFWENNLL